MAMLTDDQKLYVVQLLATFNSPTAVVMRLKEDASVEVDRSQVIRYDPTKPCFQGGDHWREIFTATRQAYLSTIQTIPIASKAFRLNELQRNYDKASRNGNIVLAISILRQAAEESAGAVPNVEKDNIRERIAAMSPEERRAAAEEMIRRTLETSRRLEMQSAASGSASIAA